MNDKHDLKKKKINNNKRFVRSGDLKLYFSGQVVTVRTQCKNGSDRENNVRRNEITFYIIIRQRSIVLNTHKVSLIKMQDTKCFS